MGCCQSSGHDSAGHYTHRDAAHEKYLATTSKSPRGARADAIRAKNRQRAVKALVSEMEHGQHIIPSSSWRRQCIKLPGIGFCVAEAIAQHIAPAMKSANHSKSTDSISAAAASSSASASRNKPHSIRVLDLRHLKMGDAGLAILARSLVMDSLVEHINLSSNDLTDDALDDVLALMKGRGARLQLRWERLAIVDNSFTADGISKIGDVLLHLPHLRHVEFGGGPRDAVDDGEEPLFSDDAITTLTERIAAHPKLTSVAVKGTTNIYTTRGLSPSSLATMISSLVAPAHVHEFFLQECFTTKPLRLMVEDGGDGHTQAHAQGHAHIEADPQRLLVPIQELSKAMMSSITKLTTLVINFPLTDEAMALFTHGLAKAQVLESLSLRGCSLTATGLRVLAKAINMNRSIVTLDVSYQSNSIAHPSVLAELRSSSKRGIYFGDHADLRATSDGMADAPEDRERPLLPLISALHRNRTLERLIMIGVNITLDDIEELCACIEKSQNHVLKDVVYTSSGCEALRMKLHNFLAANRDGDALILTESMQTTAALEELDRSEMEGSKPTSMTLADRRLASGDDLSMRESSSTVDVHASGDAWRVRKKMEADHLVEATRHAPLPSSMVVPRRRENTTVMAENSHVAEEVEQTAPYHSIVNRSTSGAAQGGRG